MGKNLVICYQQNTVFKYHNIGKLKVKGWEKSVSLGEDKEFLDLV